MLVGCIGILMAVVDSILKVGEQEHSFSIILLRIEGVVECSLRQKNVKLI